MRKRMIVLSVITFLAIVIFVVVYSEEEREVNEEVNIYTNETSSVELFIQKYLLTEDGLIRTNFSDREDGSVVLLESLGLWMEYLAAKGDMTQFERAYEAMMRHFQLSNHLLSWQIKDGEAAPENVLIDDLRIVETLFKMGELTNNHTYIDQAVDIANAVEEHHIYHGYFVDYYDTEQDEQSNFTTISHINPVALSYMEKYKVIQPKVRKQMLSLLEGLPMNQGFYPKRYYIEKKYYEYEEEINLTDQLYIGIRQQQAKVDADMLFQWVKDTFYQEDKLFSRYDAKSKKPTNSDEAVAVYSLAIVYALEREDTAFAQDLYERMRQLQVSDEADPYFGGFVTNGGDDTYSFDNLLAGIAERKLKYAKLIP